MIIKILYSIFFIIWGFLLVKYRKIVKSWTWNFGWAEQYLWRWWTYLVIILFWLGMIFLWAIYPFGWIELLTNNK